MKHDYKKDNKDYRDGKELVKGDVILDSVLLTDSVTDVIKKEDFKFEFSDNKKGLLLYF